MFAAIKAIGLRNSVRGFRPKTCLFDFEMQESSKFVKHFPMCQCEGMVIAFHFPFSSTLLHFKNYLPEGQMIIFDWPPIEVAQRGRYLSSNGGQRHCISLKKLFA